jgi:5-methylcytosine-specific restriction endonuclease McrA
MRKVTFDPTTLTGSLAKWWEEWTSRARSATAQAIKEHLQGKKPEFDSKIWSELKGFLLEHVFHGKCAYCEALIDHTSFGDAEHYRPKSKITIRHADETEVVTLNGSPHPGYFWLAYDWENLVPACQRCNSADGKMNQFPVRNSHSDVGDPTITGRDLDRLEGPLLLHPYRDDPSAHLVFGKKGVVAAKDGSDCGRTSIEVYRLDRSALSTDRQRAQELGWRRFLAAANFDADVSDILQDYRNGIEPHSTAVLNYIRLKVDELDLACQRD